MRIAFDATPALVQRGGVGRYARELLRALVQETLTDRFVLSAAANQPAIDELLTELPPGAWREVRRLPASERVMTGLWHRLRAPLAVERWIGEHDLYHGTDFTLPPTRAAKVVTIHDLSFELHPEFCHPKLASYLQEVVPRAIRRADAVIAVSASVAAELATVYPHARSKVVAIPNGFAPPPEIVNDDRARAPLVLMVGTIEPRKNHLTILKAMRAIRAAEPDARLVIVGRRGWMDDQIVAEIQRCVGEGWLTWKFDASDAELEAAYDEATVFVGASHYEGFGLPALEALARGVPCVLSDIAAHREVAAGSALFATVTRADDFAAGITRLLGDENTREALIEQGIARAAEFSWNETARRTLRVYARAAAGTIR